MIECKVLHQGRGLDGTIHQGVHQTAGYMDRCAADSGHLLIFDQRPGKTWPKRIFRQEGHSDKATVTVWGM